MIKFNKNLVLVVFILACSFGLAVLVKAATAINLGSADGYAILAGSTVTNTGTTTINGDLGLSPGSSVTGFPPGVLNGSQQIANAAAVQAQVDLVSAYSSAVSQPVTATIPTQLGNTTVVGGVYDSAAGTFNITGTVTLDGQNNPDTVFIFKADSTLITAATSNVVLVNGAQACNVFWVVGSSATLGSNSTLRGTIMASSSITLTTGANIDGRALAIGAAVTLDTNVVTKPTCITPTVTTTRIVESTFRAGPSGVVFGSAPVMPSWSIATTTEVQVVTSTTSTTTTVIPKFPNTGLGYKGGMSSMHIAILFSILTPLFFLRKNKKTV